MRPTPWPASELERIVRRGLEFAAPLFRGASITASFHPYIGLSHTIRRAGARWIVRLSDHCRDAPPEALEAIAVVLGCKIARRRVPPRVLAIYDRFRAEPEIEERVRSRTLARGRKILDTAGGRHHSLAAIFADLTGRHFGRDLDVRALGWGRRRSWGRLGHFDRVHRTITISPVLDSRRVPAEVVAYIVYHEMLHALFDEGEGRARRSHPPAFRRADRAYPNYPAVREFLRWYCSTRGRARSQESEAESGSLS